MRGLFIDDVVGDLRKDGWIVATAFDNSIGRWNERFSAVEDIVKKKIESFNFIRRLDNLIRPSEISKIWVYEGSEESCIIHSIDYFPTGTWAKVSHLGYGRDELIRPVFDSLERFYSEESQLSVRRI